MVQEEPYLKSCFQGFSSPVEPDEGHEILDAEPDAILVWDLRGSLDGNEYIFYVGEI